MTCDGANSCDLSAYLRVLSKGYHPTDESLPTVVITRLSHLPTQTSQDDDRFDLGNEREKAGISLPEDGGPLVPNDQSDAITANPKVEHTSEEASNRLQLPDGTHEEFSDASSCNYSTGCGTRTMFSKSRVRSGKRMENSSDSDNDNDGDFNDDLDAAYDSDLDSIFSNSDTKSHARKMRTWSTMAKGRFEKMLLDCIVNTGRYRNRDAVDGCVINYLMQTISRQATEISTLLARLLINSSKLLLYHSYGRRLSPMAFLRAIKSRVPFFTAHQEQGKAFWPGAWRSNQDSTCFPFQLPRSGKSATARTRR